jgi:hypothetical protein
MCECENSIRGHARKEGGDDDEEERCSGEGSITTATLCIHTNRDKRPRPPLQAAPSAAAAAAA